MLSQENLFPQILDSQSHMTLSACGGAVVVPPSTGGRPMLLQAAALVCGPARLCTSKLLSISDNSVLYIPQT